MKVKHVIRPRAKDDIIRPFRYYLLQDALEAATRFLDAVDDTIDAICKMPHLGILKPISNLSLAGLRFVPVNGFEDVLIFYTVQPNAVRIARVLHGRRDIQRILEREQDTAPKI